MNRTAPPSPLRAWSGAAALSWLILGVLYLITPIDMSMVLLGDGTTYTEIVRDLWGGRGHMHRYRILVPAIVGLLPMSVDSAFRLIQYVSCFVGALFTYGIVRGLGVPSRQAWWAIPMYLFTWPTLWNIYQYRMVDAPACAFVAAALWLILRGYPKMAILVLGVGLLAKEGVGLMIPLAAWVALSRRRSRAELLLVGAVILLALIPHLIVRARVSGVSLFTLHGDPGTGLLDTLQYPKIWLGIQMKHVGFWKSLFFTFLPFSVLWLLVPLGARRTQGLPRTVLVAWLILVSPLVFLGSPERMVEIQAPALIPLAVFGLMEAPPALAALTVFGNGLFLMRMVSEMVPVWLAWGSLGVAVAGAMWVWSRAIRVAS